MRSAEKTRAIPVLESTRASKSTSVRETRAVVGALAVGTASLMILGVQPILSAALVEARRITEGAIGLLAMAEVAGLTFGSAFGVRLFSRVDMRWTAIALSLMLLSVDLASCEPWSSTWLVVSRALAGLLEGTLLGAAVVIITRSSSPERLNGLFLAVQTIPQAIAAYLLPVWAAPRWGASAGFMCLTLFAALAAASAALLPPGRSAPTTKPVSMLSYPRMAWVGMGAIFFQSAGIGSAWNFGAELGSQLGLGSEVIGAAFSGCLIVQILAAGSVAAWFWGLAPIRMLLVGVALQIACVIALPLARESVTFIGVIWAFGAILLGLGPYQVALLIRLDRSRAAAMLLTTLTLAGWSVGPLISSVMVRPGHCEGAFGCAAACFLLAALLYLLSSRDGVGRGDRVGLEEAPLPVVTL